MEIQNRFSILGSLAADDVESSWAKLSSAIVSGGKSVIGLKRRAKQPWLSDETYDVLAKKGAARNCGLVVERRRLQGIFNAKAKLDRDAFYNKLADEAEAGLHQNSLRPAYRAIKAIAGKKGNSAPVPVKKLDGSACSSASEILSRWQEHFESALNFPQAIPCSALGDLAEATPSNPTVDTCPPSLEEIYVAVRKLKNGRAAGLDGISPELLKYAIDPISSGLHTLFLKVWQTGKILADWRDNVIVALFKGKGSKTECGSYRPISLLSVPGKVLAHVLLNRFNPLLTEDRCPQQSGFTAGRSTADAILALRLLLELHSEFKRPLYVAYVDLKSAFDSVYRTALWLALKGVGVPDVILRLIQDLHTDSGVRVRVGPDLSE